MNKIEDSPGNPNVSEADKSAITTPEQDKSKEERARILIEEIVSDKIKPLESSISQIPGLIKQTISQVLGELQQAGEQAAPQQAPGQPTQIDNEKLAGIAKIAEAVAPFFGQKTAEPDPLLNMIKDAFAKMLTKLLWGLMELRLIPHLD